MAACSAVFTCGFLAGNASIFKRLAAASLWTRLVAWHGIFHRFDALDCRAISGGQRGAWLDGSICSSSFCRWVVGFLGLRFRAGAAAANAVWSGICAWVFRVGAWIYADGISVGGFGIYLGRHAGCAKCGLDRALWAERNHRLLGGMRSLAVFTKTDFLDGFGFGWGLAQISPPPDYNYKLNDKEFVIPAGFKFDGASIPKFLRTFFSPVGVLLIGGLVHDYMYKYSACKPADKKGQLLLVDQKKADQNHNTR